MAVAKGKNGAILAAVLLLFAVGLFYYFHQGGARIPSTAYYFDEATGKELILPRSTIPPALGEGGKPTVVREFKYSDDGGKTGKVAYYYKFDDATVQVLQKAIAAGDDIGSVDTSAGELVRSTDPNSKWVYMATDEGQQISHIDIPQGRETQFAIMRP